jgi:hypothetical protein
MRETRKTANGVGSYLDRRRQRRYELITPRLIGVIVRKRRYVIRERAP